LSPSKSKSRQGARKAQEEDEARLRDGDVIDRLLAMPESRMFEAKRVGPRNDKKLETILAFANTDGGLLVLGVEDAKKAKGRDRLYGIEENPESVDELRRLVRTRFTPPIAPPDAQEPTFTKIPCTLRDGSKGHIVVVHVHKSPLVHSFVDNGTYERVDCSNRQLSAAQITELSLRRGAVSYVAQPVKVPIRLLDTEYFRAYAEARGLTRPFPTSLEHAGLARVDSEGALWPTRAAVLLFAEDPAGIMDAKCVVRIFQYKGNRIEHEAATNLVRPPRTIGGPVIAQIRDATAAVVDALATGLRVGPLGFEVVQRYPLRVIREAITNAVIHRDYFVNADIHIRIFDHRIEVESPGLFPDAVTRKNIGTIGSRPRNRQLVDHLREFPNPPNLDAGEGVPMMVSLMEQASLYPPLYTPEPSGRAAIQVTLFNEARPTIWKQVEQYLEKHGTIGNAEVRRLLGSDDALKASKQLRDWVRAGLLEVDNPEAGKSLRRYRRPGETLSDRYLSLWKTIPHGSKT